jgi:hypothetical protein
MTAIELLMTVVELRSVFKYCMEFKAETFQELRFSQGTFSFA